MKLLPLVLSAKREDWRMNDSASEDADAEFSLVKKKVRERDSNTCKFCGFKQNKADYYIQVHHRNDDHHDNRMENLVTACMHCHAVQHIGLWGSAGEAVIIYLPEWPQAFLNDMCRVVLVAKKFQTKIEGEVRLASERNPKGQAPAHLNERLKSAKTMSDAAQALFDRLRARELDAQLRLGTSDPSDLGTALLHTPEDAYGRRHQPLAPFRLLLLGHHHPGGRAESPIDKMQEITDGWLAPGGPFAGLEPAGWTRLLQSSGPR